MGCSTCSGVTRVFVGKAGNNGQNGKDGSNGKTILSGVIDPITSQGTIGDCYINTATLFFFGPKTVAGWGVGVAIGGSPGDNGDSGANGKTILSGIIPPTSEQGTDGDYFIDTAAKLFYGPKAGGAWPSGFSVVGPAGQDGADGTNGTNGTSVDLTVIWTELVVAASLPSGVLYPFRTFGSTAGEPVSYWKDPFGFIHLKGLITFINHSLAASPGAALATLPVGCRPAINYPTLFDTGTISGGTFAAFLGVQPNGNIGVYANTTPLGSSGSVTSTILDLRSIPPFQAS